MQHKEQGCKGSKPCSLKPSKSLPHWHPLPKWVKNLEGQYNKSSPIMCAFLMIWVKSNAHIQWRIDGGDQTILRIQRLHKKDTNWNPLEGYQLQKKDAFTRKQAIKGSKKNNWAQEDIMIRSTKCSKNQEGTPQGTCTMKDLYFNIACITWNPHSLLDNFEHKQMLSNKK